MKQKFSRCFVRASRTLEHAPRTVVKLFIQLLLHDDNIIIRYNDYTLLRV